MNLGKVDEGKEGTQDGGGSWALKAYVKVHSAISEKMEVAGNIKTNQGLYLSNLPAAVGYCCSNNM